MQLPGWLQGVMPALQQYGLPGLFAGVFVESFGLPVPGETMIIFFATMAGAGKFGVVSVGLTAFVAAVLGDNVGYLIGRYAGRQLIVAHGSRFGISEQRMHRAETIIAKRGVLVVSFARFFPLLRQLNGLAAGAAGMHWLRFLAANAVGAALWVTAWVALASRLGAQAHLLPMLTGHLNLVAAAVIAIVLAVLILRAFRRARRHRAPAD